MMTFHVRQALGLLPAALVMLGGVVLGDISVSLIVPMALAMVGGAVWCGTQVPAVAEAVPETPPEPVVENADLLDALPGPVMILDQHRRVIFANRAAFQHLGSDILRRDLALVLRQPEALGAADQVLSGKSKRAEASVATSQAHRRHFEVQAQALPKDNPWRGAVVYALFDVTAVKEAEEMRADFVANVSHELRSPLTALIGFIETLRGSAKDDPEARERFLEIMDGEAQRMKRLIADLLSLSRIEVSEGRRPETPVDVQEILKEVKAALAPRAKEKGVEIKLSLGKKIERVRGDRDQLTEVFHNLVDNALKYGRDAEPVRVKISMMDDMPGIRRRGVVVSVMDKSEGIEPDKIPRLTERFYRVDKGRSRAIGGTGLGLAIVKHILNRHQGRLAVESVVGQGSAFTVYLPL